MGAGIDTVKTTAARLGAWAELGKHTPLVACPNLHNDLFFT